MMKKTTFLFLMCMLSVLQVFAQNDYDFVVDGIYYKYDMDAMTAAVVHYPYDGGIEYRGAITIPATVKYGRFEFDVTEVAQGAFNSCYNLTSITFKTSNGKGVKKIGRGAFVGCWKLEKVDLPNTLTSIAEFAFSSCYVLKTIKIPSGVTKIEKSTFDNCEALESIELPPTMERVGIAEAAFYGCGLTSITIPKGVLYTGKRAFSHCKKLKTVILPDDFYAINAEMFTDCTSLSNINFPNSLKLILISYPSSG